MYSPPREGCGGGIGVGRGCLIQIKALNKVDK